MLKTLLKISIGEKRPTQTQSSLLFLVIGAESGRKCNRVNYFDPITRGSFNITPITLGAGKTSYPITPPPPDWL